MSTVALVILAAILSFVVFTAVLVASLVTIAKQADIAAERMFLDDDRPGVLFTTTDLTDEEYLDKTEPRFTEETLRRDIERMWGPHGAHADLYRTILGRLRTLEEAGE